MVSSDGTKITKSQTCARSLFLQKNFEEQKVDKRGCSARMGRIPAICFTSEGHGGLSSWECQEILDKQKVHRKDALFRLEMSRQSILVTTASWKNDKNIPKFSILICNYSYKIPTKTIRSLYQHLPVGVPSKKKPKKKMVKNDTLFNWNHVRHPNWTVQVSAYHPYYYHTQLT